MIFQDPMTAHEPGLHGRGPDLPRRSGRTRTRSRQAAGAGAAVELLRAGRDPEPGAARGRLSAPVLGRHAPARDDRDGAREQPRRADRRRADDRARRDDPGADHRADRPAQGRVQLGRDPDHARSRRRGGHRGRDHASCTRAASSSWGRSARSSTTRSTRTRGGCSARSRDSTGPKADRLHSIAGTPPSLINLPQRLQVPPALPARVREVLGGAAAREPRRGARRISTAAGSRSR